jgi:hypothetical protein
LTLSLSCLLFAGCATPSSDRNQEPASTLRPSYTPISDPPLAAKGRMIIRPFADNPGSPYGIPGTSDVLHISQDPSLSQTVSEALADASRFAGYETRVSSDIPESFQPDVVVEGDIQSCEMSTDAFAGMRVTMLRLDLRVRMKRPDDTLPFWEGNVTGSAGNFPGRRSADRLVTYEVMLRDSVNRAMQEWIETLNAATPRAAGVGESRLARTSSAER